MSSLQVMSFLDYPRCPKCHNRLRIKPRHAHENGVKIHREGFTGNWSNFYYCGQCGKKVQREQAVIHRNGHWVHAEQAKRMTEVWRLRKQ